MDEVREEVARGCAVAEAVLQLPQSRAVLPFIVLEHSAVLPSQAASWRAALKVWPHAAISVPGRFLCRSPVITFLCITLIKGAGCSFPFFCPDEIVQIMAIYSRANPSTLCRKKKVWE